MSLIIKILNPRIMEIKIIFSKIIILSLLTYKLNSQKIITNGSIIIGKDTSAVNNPGSIRWTGSDFEGWTGTTWLSLTVANQVRDLDGNIYHPLKIGGQVWLEENLKTTKYNDGTTIPFKDIQADWSAANLASSPAYCWYNNDILNKNIYGGLYNFYALDSIYNGGKNLCPIGWHVPSFSEWNTLINFLGGTSLAGGLLKESGFSHWVMPNNDATNISGFTGLPGGRRGPSGTFASIGEAGYYRTRTRTPDPAIPHSFYVLLNTTTPSSTNTLWNNGIGMSIRCIRD
jgi:uncharacterized protein (TIGR02145 family)